ncbi:type III-B CRISPR module-associated Cmr3 family protein [Nitrospira sp. Nam80]
MVSGWRLVQYRRKHTRRNDAHARAGSIWWMERMRGESCALADCRPLKF